jgi:hypothetical protein
MRWNQTDIILTTKARMYFVGGEDTVTLVIGPLNAIASNGPLTTANDNAFPPRKFGPVCVAEYQGCIIDNGQQAWGVVTVTPDGIFTVRPLDTEGNEFTRGGTMGWTMIPILWHYRM